MNSFFLNNSEAPSAEGAPASAKKAEYYQHALQVARRAIDRSQRKRPLGDRLLALFGIRISRDEGTEGNNTFVHGVASRKDLERLSTIRDPRTGHLKNIPEKLKGELGGLFDAYVTDNFESVEALREKETRYNELDFMYINDPFISSVADMMADEATQIDQQDNLISIESPSTEQTERMYALLDDWGIDHQQSRDTLFNLNFYGDALWGLKLTNTGITGTKPQSPRLLKERLEFNPLRTKERLLNLHNSWMTQTKTRDRKLDRLLQMIDSDQIDDFSDLFDTYLFGYDIADAVVPPWAAYHFRLNPNQSEFFPYGRSNFIKALAPFKQMSSTFILQAMARIMSFPVREMKIKTTPGMSESDIFNKINTVRERFEGQGYGFPDVASDPYALLSTVWTADDLMTLNVIESRTEMDFVGDLELLVDRVAMASGAPKGYLVQEWGGWGNSGLSLTEQHKPFARRIFSLQSAYLEGLADIFRLHFAVSGEYDYTQPFQLSMNFPNSEIDNDRQNAKSSSLDLAGDVIDIIQNALGVEGVLPYEVIRDILTSFTFIRSKDLEKWMNMTRRKNPELTKEDPGEAAGDDSGADISGFGDLEDFAESRAASYLKRSLRVYESGGASEKKANIISRYLETRQALHLHARVHFRLTEGVINRRHFLVAKPPSSANPLDLIFKVSEEIAREDGHQKLKG